MRTLNKIALIALMSSLVPGTVWAQDHAAAPMIGAPEVQPDTSSAYRQAIKTKSEFRRAYRNAGKPKLAIFWNRKLDDQLSQWYTASRNIDTRDGWWGKGFTARQNRLDVERRFDNRPAPEELRGFEFGAGYTSTLLSNGVDIVDRDAIMRLTHSKSKEAAPNIVVADYQQVELDALVGYADYFAEILYAAPQNGDANLNFMISIKEVKTGRLITMFRSRNVMPQQDYQYKWSATADGYKKVKVPVIYDQNPYDGDGIAPGTPEHIGWNVAMQTMQALTKYWSPKY
jgi:hypothetical protein